MAWTLTMLTMQTHGRTHGRALSRPSRFGGHRGAFLIGVAGTSPAMKCLCVLRLLEAALGDDLGEGAVGGAELQRIGLGLGENLAAVLFDRIGEGGAILDLDAPMVDARAGTG